MVNSKELMIGAWVRSSKDFAQVTALYKEDDDIHVEGNLFCGDDSSPEEEVALIPEGLEVKEQSAHKYAAIHIERPFDNPFATIPGAYHTLGDYMRTNGLVYAENEVIPCFETDGESMDVYMACR